MLVRTDEKTLSFKLREGEGFPEMGYQLIKQEKLPQQLPFKRQVKNGREKLVFMLDAPQVKPVMELEGKLDEAAVLDIVYELFFLTGRVCENGFLKRECIWCRYENLYYDTDEGRLKLALLPVLSVSYAEAKGWNERFLHTVSKLTEGLEQKKSERAVQLAQLLVSKKIAQDEALSGIEALGSGRSGLLADKPSKPRLCLRLYYSGKNGSIEFLVDDKDFVIGRSREKADGLVDENVSRAVSRRHCFITRLGNKFFAQDLESANHTLVNGIVIPPYELMQLENNDILSIADVDFRVRFVEEGM